MSEAVQAVVKLESITLENGQVMKIGDFIEFNRRVPSSEGLTADLFGIVSEISPWELGGISHDSDCEGSCLLGVRINTIPDQGTQYVATFDFTLKLGKCYGDSYDWCRDCQKIRVVSALELVAICNNTTSRLKSLKHKVSEIFEQGEFRSGKFLESIRGK